MASLLLPFVLALMLVIIANIGQVSAWARWLIYALLLVMSAGVALGGVAMAYADPSLTAELVKPEIDLTARWFSLWLVASGGLASLPVLAAIVASTGGQDPQVGRLYWSRPVQLTALVLAVLYAGINLAISAAISDPAALATLTENIGSTELVVQYGGFVTLALLGVGLGIRRDWRETLRRLGSNRIEARELSVVVVATIGMVIMSALFGAIIAVLFPGSLGDVEAFNQGLLVSFGSPLGALALGLLSGFGEEILYRGALQPAFGLLATSLIFALHHSQYVNPGLLIVFALGVILGLIRNRWGTTTAALTHAAYNTTLVLLSVAASQVIDANLPSLISWPF